MMMSGIELVNMKIQLVIVFIIVFTSAKVSKQAQVNTRFYPRRLLCDHMSKFL